MNSLEAARVLAVLDEARDGLRLLSAVGNEVLQSAEQIKDLVDEALGDAILAHRDAVADRKGKSLQEGGGTTMQLWRLLKQNPEVEAKLRGLQARQSPATTQLISTFEKLRAAIQKQLTTTVEEDTSNQEHFHLVKEREERAFSEKTQLEQKIKLQRIERQKQLSTITGTEEKATRELEMNQGEAEAANNSLKAAAAATREADNAEYKSVKEQLLAQLTAARGELAAIHEDNKELESQLRKAKKRAEQDVESVIHSFDKDMMEREKEYQENLAVYNELQKQITEYSDNIQQLKKQREDHEAEQQRIRDEQRKAQQRQRLINTAATMIQKAWKLYKVINRQ
eukprot:evm.model.scf_876.1 EVM.evm.TU.scf_876.1   scf_876:2363-5648(+)